MKILKLLALGLITTIISACSGSELHITGRMHKIDTLGLPCWYVTDTVSGYNYEILRSENYVFSDGLKVSIKAKAGSGSTVCQVGDKIEIVSYKLL